MRVLITGASGFVGRHLIEALNRAGHASIALDLPGAKPATGAETVACDLMNAGELAPVLRRLQPDACIHLAGIAFVPMGWTDPCTVMNVNVIGTINLLEALRRERPRTRALIITSAEIYGREPRPAPIREDDPRHPSNLYAVSKLSADATALLYARRYDMPVMTARPQNHTGPGQASRFVAPSFAEQLIRLSQCEGERVMRVGNLDSHRDFLDVRDVAEAYRLLIEKGRPGEGYNVASGVAIRIGDLLDQLCELCGVRPRIEVDPERYRPVDDPPLLDIRRIRETTGWEPRIPMRRTLADIVADMKERTRHSS